MAKSNPFSFIYGEGQALAYIIRGIAEETPLEDIITDLDKGGITIASEKVESVYNYIQNTVLPSEQYIKQLQQFATPNILRIPLSMTSTLRNFAYTVAVQGFNSLTGQLQTKQITISTNVLLNKQQAIDIAGEFASGDTKSGGLESAAGSVTSITQNSAGLVIP